MAWEQYKTDFNAMSDEEIASEVEQSQALVDENQDWIDAVCPHCSYRNAPDQDFFYDVRTTEVFCLACGEEFAVRISVQWTWDTEDQP